MKTRRWKRALSVVLSGALLMTSLSAAMTAFAAEDVTQDSEYQSLIAAAAEKTKTAAFDEATVGASSYSFYLYDNQAGDLKAYMDAALEAARKLNALDPEAYADYATAQKQVAEDIQAVEGVDEAADAAIAKIAESSSVYVYPYFLGDAASSADFTDSYKFTYYSYRSSNWTDPAKMPSTSTYGSVSNLKSNLDKFKTSVTEEFLNKDLTGVSMDDLVQLYKDNETVITNLSKYPSWILMDANDDVVKAKAKLDAVGEAEAQIYLTEAQAFQTAYATPAAINSDNYEEAAAQFAALAETQDKIDSDIVNDTLNTANAIYETYYYEQNYKGEIKTGKDMLPVLVGILETRTQAAVEKYSSVTEANKQEALDTVAAIRAIVSGTPFAYTLYLDDAEGVQEAIADLTKVQGQIDIMNGEDAAFMNGVAELKATYEANGNKFLPEEAEELTATVDEVGKAYDALTADAKTLDKIIEAKAEYDMLAEAVAAALLEARTAPYEEAVNAAKENWGDPVGELAMTDWAAVRADLSAMDAAYAKFNDEQKADEQVVALHEYHAALQAAHDAAVAGGSYVPSDFTYPEGLNEEAAAEALATLDTVLTNPDLVAMLGNALGVTVANNASLKDLVKSLIETNLYTDDMVTTIVSMIYPALQGMLGDQASIASILDIYVLPSGVAGQISEEYPEAKAAIAAGGSAWTDSEGNSTIDWSAVKWNVTDEDSFYKALGQGLNGLNALLNCILNDVDISKSIVIISAGLTGIEGYRTTIVPLLELLGCKDIMTPEEYAADQSTEALIRNLLTMILDRVYEICEAPATELVSILPQLAYFLNADGLKTILSALQITGTGAASSVNINIYDTLSASVDLSDLNALLSGLITGAVPGFNWVDIDFAYLAGLGSAETVANAAGDNYVKVTGDNSKVTVALLEYVGKVLNANAQFIKDSIPAIADENLAGVVNGLLDTVLNAEPGKIATALVHFIAPQCETAVSPYNYPEIEQNGLVIPEGVVYGEDAYAQTPAALDALLKGFGLDLSSLVSGALYTDDLIAQVFGLYDTIRANATVAQVFDALGIDISEETITALKAEAGSVTDQASFVKALTTALSPFDDVLAMLFAGEDYSVFGYTVKGMDNYNTVVIPLLEVLGCTDVMSYADYQAAVAGGASPLEAIVTQVLARLNEILASPVDNLTKVLPNVAYFLDSNNLSVMVKNLLAPLDTLLAHVDVDLMATVNSLLTAFGIPSIDDLDNDLAGLLNQVLGMIEVGGAPLALVLPNIDLHKLASYGTAETYTSAMVIDGQNVEAKRIVADQAAVTGAVIGYLYEVLADEATMDLITSLLGDSGAMVEGILGGLLGNGEAGFTNALFELLGFTPKADDNNGGEGGNGNEGGNENVDTGDAMLAVVAGAGVLAAGAILVLSRKKKEK